MVSQSISLNPLHMHTYQGPSFTMEIMDIGNTILSHSIRILPCPMTELGATGVICTHPGPNQDSNTSLNLHLLFSHPLILSAAPPSHPASLRTKDKGQVMNQAIDHVTDHVINYVIKSCNISCDNVMWKTWVIGRVICGAKGEKGHLMDQKDQNRDKDSHMGKEWVMWELDE